MTAPKLMSSEERMSSRYPLQFSKTHQWVYLCIHCPVTQQRAGNTLLVIEGWWRLFCNYSQPMWWNTIFFTSTTIILPCIKVKFSTKSPKSKWRNSQYRIVPWRLSLVIFHNFSYFACKLIEVNLRGVQRP